MNTLKLEAYNTIKERIIQCEYPPNCLLNEEWLKEELRISRTPIRDALSRLEQESLIQILPRRGIMVKGVSPDEVEQVFEMRMLIEPYSLKKYGQIIDKEIFRGMEASFSLNPEETLNDVIHKGDDEFHHLFINASKNVYIIEAYKSVYNQNIRLRILSGNLGKDRMLQSQKEHRAITRHCLKGNWDQAAILLGEHLVKSKEASYNAINNIQILLRRQGKHSPH